jgi:hypothetical protein
MPNTPPTRGFGPSSAPFLGRRFDELDDAELVTLRPKALEAWIDAECWHRGLFRPAPTDSRKVRNRIMAARAKVYQEMRKLQEAAASREKRRTDLRARFESFISMANGSKAIAWRFFRLIYPDAITLLPELWKPEPSSQGVTRAIDFEVDP